MVNSTNFSHFILGAFIDTGRLKYLCFTITAILYTIIVFANSFLIGVICMKRSLHEPMYIFLCNLFVNELYGSVCFFPSLLVQLVSDTHTISVPLCFLQIFCLYTYGHIEFCNLALMSYDRYLAICCPLQYNTHMTSNKVALFIAVVWLYCFMKFLITLSLSIRLQLCGNMIDSVYCSNYPVVKLACSDTRVNNIYGIIVTILAIFVPSILIIFSYTKILKICLVGSKETRQKAVSTCTPHLASLLNFFFASCYAIFHSRFDMTSVPNVLRIIISSYFVVCQVLFNPIMYGMRMSKIRQICKDLFSSQINCS
ncbi:olfactory receptor 2K2-like [Polymixia lowei]